MALTPRFSGSIEVVCGSMFSGKTEELIRRLKRAQIAKLKVQCFKPVIDDRYSKDHVMSHDSSKILSIPVAKSSEIMEKVEDNTRVVGVDEAQFFDAGIVEICQKLANRGVRVVVAGLDMDYLGNPFEPMPKLLAIAENVTKLHAICMACGTEASRSQRIVAGDDQISVGSKEQYEARCRSCHDINETKQSTLTFPPIEGSKA